MSLLVAEGMSKEDAQKYQQNFDQQRITKVIAIDLTRADMKELGIPFGHVLQMETAFRKLKMLQEVK